MNIIHVCIVASQAFLATQTITLPDGRRIVENVTILQPCRTGRHMNSIFYERAWRRVRKLRNWSKLG